MLVRPLPSRDLYAAVWEGDSFCLLFEDEAIAFTNFHPVELSNKSINWKKRNSFLVRDRCGDTFAFLTVSGIYFSELPQHVRDHCQALMAQESAKPSSTFTVCDNDSLRSYVIDGEETIKSIKISEDRLLLAVVTYRNVYFWDL